MRTWTGSLAPLGENVGKVDLLDLVMHAGRESRWGGWGSTEYKVIHHTTLVTLLWIKAGYPREGLPYVFAHDLHECYTGDIPSPVKRLLGAKELEKMLDGRIYETLNLPPPDAETLRYVRICDLAALVLEAPLFGPPGAASGDKTNPKSTPLTPAQNDSPYYHPDVPKDLQEPVADLLRLAFPNLAAIYKARGVTVRPPL